MELCSAAYRDMYALGLQGDSLFMIGGQMKLRNQYIITDSVERWSLKRGGSWLSFAPLPLPLACHCVVSLRDYLYVLGGWTPQVCSPKYRNNNVLFLLTTFTFDFNYLSS